jgi:hypothetical protein
VDSKRWEGLVVGAVDEVFGVRVGAVVLYAGGGEHVRIREGGPKVKKQPAV